MPYTPFDEKFPVIAHKETRSFQPWNNPLLGDDEFGLLEMYCDEPGCDCRRVMFSVLSRRYKKIVAYIGYGWESAEFYANRFSYSEPDDIPAIQGPTLNIMSPQSKPAPAILAQVEVVLQDQAYADRLKRHYAMFRETIEEEAAGSVKPRRKRPRKPKRKNRKRRSWRLSKLQKEFRKKTNHRFRRFRRLKREKICVICEICGYELGKFFADYLNVDYHEYNENQFRPDYVSIPGETLLETFETIGMSQAELVQRMGRLKKTINEIIQGKTAITAETALQLEMVLGVPASFWLNREQQYQEARARIEEEEQLEKKTGWLDEAEIPVKLMCQWGWITQKTRKIDQLREVLRFFGVASVTQ